MRTAIVSFMIQLLPCKVQGGTGNALDRCRSCRIVRSQLKGSPMSQSVVRHRTCGWEPRHRDTVSQMHQRRNFMRFVALRACVIGFMMVSVASILPPAQLVLAEEGTQSFGGIEAGKWVLGMMAGFAPVTQSLTNEFRSSTDVGSLVNFQAMYSLNRWLLAGMMLE